MLAPVTWSANEKRTVPELAVLVNNLDNKAELAPEEREVMEMTVVRSQQFLDFLRAFSPPPEGENGDPVFLEKIRQDPTKYTYSFDVNGLDTPFPRPALIITGRQDTSVGYRDAWDLLQSYPRATYVTFDRAGHFL